MEARKLLQQIQYQTTLHRTRAAHAISLLTHTHTHTHTHTRYADYPYEYVKWQVNVAYERYQSTWQADILMVDTLAVALKCN